MNFEAKVLHENGIRPRLRKSPLNLKQHLRTPTWRLPGASRLSNVRCFSELRMQVTYMESSYLCQQPHCSVEQVGQFGPVWLPPFAQDVQLTFLQFSPQPLRCMKTEPAHTWQAGVGQDHPLLRFCDLDIFKLMNFEAKVLHENGIRPRLRKSPLNLKQHLGTPTWRLPVALRLSNAAMRVVSQN